VDEISNEKFKVGIRIRLSLFNKFDIIKQQDKDKEHVYRDKIEEIKNNESLVN